MKKEDRVDIKKLIELEEELQQLKRENGMVQPTKWWVAIGDKLAEKSAVRRAVNRKKYIKLALSCGWFCGSHRFYAGQKIMGTLYLLFFWTGIPFAMTVIDLMGILPLQEDEQGMVLI
ncbi:TM2 domain-containing protein [Clostridiales bacterium COT073_COT-073]|nr:TM2 domain-containing protein [Clostridiales bacterium COT073_COT-073]